MLAIIVTLSGANRRTQRACGLCRARRRKTNEVQANICIVSIQILRRYAPQNDELLLNCELIPLRGLDFGCALVMLEQVRNDSRLAPSSLLLGKARERALLSLNRKVVHFELFPAPR